MDEMNKGRKTKRSITENNGKEAEENKRKREIQSDPRFEPEIRVGKIHFLHIDGKLENS